jgi:hypothetical protein
MAREAIHSAEPDVDLSVGTTMSLVIANADLNDRARECCAALKNGKHATAIISNPINPVNEARAMLASRMLA